MSNRTLSRALLLPTVLIVCAVMLLPGASLFAPEAPHHAGAATQSSSATPSATVTGSTASSGLNLPAAPTTGANAINLPRESETHSLPSWLQPSTGNFASPLGSGTGLVSYPNIGLARDQGSSPSSIVSPGYQAPPAPMGLADYGVGPSSAYAYNTTGFLATVNLTTPPNVTAPDSAGVIDPAGSHLGLVGSPYEFSLQLNTVVTNVTIPGTNVGVFWTQNVLDINDTGIHFVDDIFNLSTESGFYIPSGNPPTIASGCGSSNVGSILSAYGGVYQCVGKTLAITAASYPLSIQLYNNASVNAQDQDQVTFGYHILAHGKLLATGVSDTVAFYNPNGTVAPANPVAFEVNGFQRAPAQPAGYPQLLEDSEVIFGGPIGGTNAVFRSLDGSLVLQHKDGTGWKSISSGYDFGSDTGETSIGIAGYWNASAPGTESINQGPSFLYGLWNGLRGDSVASGDIQFKGSVEPSYGFVFVSNVVPGPNGTNYSWVPTTESGTFDSYLPPAIPAGGLAYNTVFYAAGYLPDVGSNFSASNTSYTFPTPLYVAPYVDAPLYMWGNTQAEELAQNVTGWTSGPYVFSNLVVNLPFAFTHLNDYDFPSFGIFQAEDLQTTPVYVNNTSEGWNVLFGENYTLDYANVSSWNLSSPSPIGPVQNYTEQFNIFGSKDAEVTNEVLLGTEYYGGVWETSAGGEGGLVFLWGDTDTIVSDVDSLYGSYGVANVISEDTLAENLFAAVDAYGVIDDGSTYTYVYNVTAVDGSYGVYAIDSFAPEVQDAYSVGGSIAFASGGLDYAPAYYALYGAEYAYVVNVNATDDSIGVADSFSYYDEFVNISADDADVAALVLYSTGDVVHGLNATESAGLGVEGSNETYANDVNVFVVGCGFCNGVVGVFGSNSTTLDAVTIDLDFSGFSTGLEVEDSDWTTVTDATLWLFDSYDDDGAWIAGSAWTSLVGTVVQLGYSDYTAGIVAYFTVYTNVTSTTVVQNYTNPEEEEYFASVGVVAAFSDYTNVTSTTVNQTVSVVDTEGEDDVGTNLTGVLVLGSNYTNVSGTEAYQNFSSYDVGEVEDNDLSFTGVWVAASNYTQVDSTLAVQATAMNYTDWVQDSDAYFSGVYVDSSNWTSVNGTVAYELFSVNDLYEEESSSYGEFAAVEVFGSNHTTVVLTTTFEDLALSYSDSVYETEAWFGGVLVGDAVWTSISKTTASESSTIAYLDDLEDSDAQFFAVGSEDVGWMTVASTTVTTSSTFVYTYVYHSQLYMAGVYTDGGYYVSVTGVSFAGDLQNLDYGVYAFESEYVTANGVNVSDGAIGVNLDEVSWASIDHVDATALSIGANVTYSDNVTVRYTTASNLSVGVSVYDSGWVTISGVNATNTTVSSPWTYAFQERWWGMPVSAVLLEASGYVHIWNVTATDYPAALYDGYLYEDSFAVYATNIVANDGMYLALLNDTEDSVFTNLVGHNDQVGLAVTEYAEDDEFTGVNVTGATSYGVWVANSEDDYFYDVNASSDGQGFSAVESSYLHLWGSSFRNDASYGVYLFEDDDVWVYANNFTGDNGATTTYNPLHIQAYAGYSNYGIFFDNPWNTSGNYWADWHTYTSEGVLAPYYTGDGNYDYHPLGAPAGTDVVLFWAYGLNSGTVWSVTFDGTTQSTSTGLLEFPATHGATTYSYTVAPVAGYVATPASGTVTVTTAWTNVSISFEAVSTVTVTETGLPAETSWSATVGGVTSTSTSASMTFTLAPGTYPYSIVPVAGYTASAASGTITVGSSPYSWVVTFTQVEVTATFAETGLPSGTAWTVTVGETPYSTSGSSISLDLPNGSYSYAYGTVSGYSVTGGSGTLTVSGFPTGTVATYSAVPVPVTLREEGLPSSATWNGTIGGQLLSASEGGALSVSLVPGTYTYGIEPIPGYTISAPTGTLVVGSAGYTGVVVFTPVKYAVTFSETGLSTGTAWSVLVGGQTYTTSGTSITVDLANGSVAYTFESVSGYNLAGGSGTVQVSGSPSGAMAGYSPSSTPSYVTMPTFNGWETAALAIAVIAVLLALFALLRKPRSPTPPPATAWQEPPASQGGSSGGTGH